MSKPARTWMGIALAAGFLVLSLGRALWHSGREVIGDKIVIRFAHTQLEPGVREAFEAAARDYMLLRPGVIVEQLAVPRRTWPQWLETRLIGDDPPDLLQLVNNDPNLLLRHFQPIDRWMDQPNPHNDGTPLAGIPWKDTFIAPLADPPTYWPRFLHYYGAPLTIFTSRLYLNLSLLREITGSENQPADYAEFVSLCRRIAEWSRNEKRSVFAVAGTRPVPPNDWFFAQLLRSQSQRLLLEKLDRTDSLAGGGGAGGDYQALGRDAYFRRKWSIRDPEFQSGFRLVKEVGQFFQPGFLAADRDDALFYFLQERTVMIASGSWDYQSIASQADFKIGAIPIPVPGTNDPNYGEHTLGPMSEAVNLMRGAFALARNSRHPEAAVDFLRYLTSTLAHEKFSRTSKWVPVVRGVPIIDELKPLAPKLDGYPLGLNFNVGVETTRLWENHLNLLYAGEDGVERITARLAPLMDRAVWLDEAKESRNVPDIITNYDTRALAHAALSDRTDDSLLTPEKLSELQESQTDLELNAVRLYYHSEVFLRSVR